MHKRKEVYNMICTTPKELLAEIKKYMDLHNIPVDIQLLQLQVLLETVLLFL